jgi:hypothetical protein
MNALQTTGKMRLDDGNRNAFRRSARQWSVRTPIQRARRRTQLIKTCQSEQIADGTNHYLGNVG